MRLIFVMALTALVLQGCSGTGSQVDTGAGEVTGDVSGDVLMDSTVADNFDDESEDDRGAQDVEDDAADVMDATDVMLDDGPALPWHAQLVPDGQKISELMGVASHMETSEVGDAQTDFEFDQYQAAGGMRARRGFRWSEVEPVEGEFHWEKTNGAVTRSAEHGVKLIPVVYYGNNWAEDETSAYGSLDITKYANYAGAMAEQYCESIKEYELWNEQNITRFWHIPPDPAKYANMLALASQSIKAECPDAKVVFGGMTSYDDVDMFDTWNYLRRALEARPDLCDYFEGVALHPYTFFQFDSPEFDEEDWEYVKRGQTWQTEVARQILRDAGCQEKALYYTELGWPTYDLTREEVARYAARSMLIASRDRIEGWYWYTFWDDDPSDASSIRPHENHFGLFEWPGADDTNRTPKPAWNALMAMLDIIGQGRIAADVGAIMGLPNDVYVLAFEDDDKNLVLAMWDGRNQPDIKFGVPGEGGADTTFQLELELPSDAVSVSVFDMYGVEVSSATATASMQVTLTPAVQYLKVER